MKTRTKTISVLLSLIMLFSVFTVIPVQFSADNTDMAGTGADTDIGSVGDGSFVYKLVDSVTAGREYLIVSANEAGSAFALANEGGSSSGTSMARTSVTVSSGDVDNDGSADLYIAEATSDIVWTATANGNGFNLTNGSDYLEGKSGNVKIYDVMQYADRYWTYVDSQLKFVGGSVTYTLYYSGSNFTSTYNDSDETIYVFEKTSYQPADSGVVNVGFTSDVHDNTEALTNFLNAVQSDYSPKLDVMAYCGDYSYQFNKNGSVSAFNEIVSITNELVGENKGYYTTGNHEYLNASGIIEAIQDTPGFKLFGEQIKTDKYIIFAMGARSSSDAYTDDDINALDEYLAAAPKDIPVFITTHYPLHTNSSRTTKNADKVIEALNKYPNVIFLWGHNHSMSDPHYGEIKTAGDSINYASNKSKEINFTYLASGSMYKESQVKNNSGLVATISGDDVKSVTFQYHRSSNGDKVGGPITVYMDGSDPSDPPSVPPSVPPTPVTQPKEYVFKLTDTMKNGGEYLIVNTNAAGSGYSLKNNGGTSDGTSLASDSVLILKSDLNNDGVQDTYIKHGTTDTVWLATANEGGFKLTNNDDYLDAKSGNIKIFDEQRYDDRYWTYSASQLKYVGSSTTYTLYYSSSSFTSSTSSSTSASRQLYIYERTATNGSVQPATQAPATQAPATQAPATQAPATQAPATQRPTSAPYTGDVVNVGFTSDIHDNTNSLRLFLTAAQNDYSPKLDAAGYCGDYSYQFNKSGHVAAFNEIVSINNELVGENTGYYTTGNHEYLNASGIIEAIQDTPGFKIFGEQKRTDRYIIFAMGAESSSDAYTDADIEALDKYMASVPSDIPVFITTHYPLHTFSSRTTKNADKVIEVLNQYPNAVFFWGHNHTMSDSHYGEILTAGDSITYSSGKSKAINFTYLAAGALYRASQTEYGAVVATIKGSDVTFQYYRSAASDKIGSPVTVSMLGESVPSTQAPATQAPATQAPATQAPATQAPATQAPATQKPTVAPITGDYVFKLTDIMKAGGEYLIVNKNEEGSAYALTNDGGSSSGTSLARTSVTVSTGDVDKDNVSDTYIASATSDLVWTATANEDGFNLTNNGGYLSGKSGNIKIYDSVQYYDRYWTYEDSQLRFVGNNITYTLYYGSGNFTSSTSSNSNKIYIYEKFAVEEIPTEPTQPTVPTQPNETIPPTDPPTESPTEPIPTNPPTQPTEPTEPETTGEYVYKLTDTIKDGGEYLIVNSYETGSAYAMKNNGGTSAGTNMDSTPVTVYPAFSESRFYDEYDKCIKEASPDIVWTASANEDGFTLTNGTDYLEGKSGNVRIYNSVQYPDRYWTYSDYHLRFVNPSTNANAITYTLYYASDKFTYTYNDSNGSVYLYEKTAAEPYRPYIIEYDANDGRGVIFRQELSADGTAVIREGLTRKNYDFTSWCLYSGPTCIASYYYEPGERVSIDNNYYSDFLFSHADSNNVIRLYAQWVAHIIVPLNQEVSWDLSYLESMRFEFIADEDDYYLIKMSSSFDESEADRNTIKYLKKGESFIKIFNCSDHGSDTVSMHVTKTPIRSMMVEATKYCYLEDKQDTENRIYSFDEFDPIISLFNENNERVFRGTKEEMKQMLELTVLSERIQSVKEPQKYYMPVQIYDSEIKCEMKCYILRDRSDSPDNYETVLIRGDADGDGEVTIIDATYVKRYEALMNIPISEEIMLLCGDVEGNGEVSIIDATYIQRYDAGFPTPYSIGRPITEDPIFSGDVYKYVEKITPGKEYLIVSSNSRGIGFALKNSGGSSAGTALSRASVTINSADLNNDGVTDYYITNPSSNLIWNSVANGEGFDLINGTDYLVGTRGEVSIYDEQVYADRYFTYDKQQLKYIGGSNTYTLYYSDGFTSTNSSTNKDIYVFEKTSDGR